MSVWPGPGNPYTGVASGQLQLVSSPVMDPGVQRSCVPGCSVQRRMFDSADSASQGYATAGLPNLYLAESFLWRHSTVLRLECWVIHGSGFALIPADFYLFRLAHTFGKRAFYVRFMSEFLLSKLCLHKGQWSITTSHPEIVCLPFCGQWWLVLFVLVCIGRSATSHTL